MAGIHLLIVGAGSVGKRHAQNLASLGCKLCFVDPRRDRREEVDGEDYVTRTYSSIDEAINGLNHYDGVVIASPPAFHVQQSLTAIEYRLPILLEKPVSPDEASARQLQTAVNNSGVPLLLGYTWRWWEPLGRVRELVQKQAVGELRHVQFVMSAHLADWHPWENYQDFFMASKALGGGALLDESHWIDLMFWILGPPNQVFATIDKISSLEIDTDDNVDMIARYNNGLGVTMHLDLYGRPHQKFIRFVGERGTIYWTVQPNRVAVSDQAQETWEETIYECERNDMFLATAREFIDIISGNPVSTCTIDDGVKVLSLIESMRKSSDLRSMVDWHLQG